MALDDGRRAGVHPLAWLEIVQPGREPTPMPEPCERIDLPSGVGADQAQWTRPLPAANTLELVARWEATDHLPRALAFYDALCQLHISDTPEKQVAQLWLGDQQAAIVVQTWDQADAVRQAISEGTPNTVNSTGRTVAPDGFGATPTKSERAHPLRPIRR